MFYFFIWGLLGVLGALGLIEMDLDNDLDNGLDCVETFLMGLMLGGIIFLIYLFVRISRTYFYNNLLLKFNTRFKNRKKSYLLSLNPTEFKY